MIAASACALGAIALLANLALAARLHGVWSRTRRLRESFERSAPPAHPGLLSVLIPAYNEAGNIVPCLEAVAAAAATMPVGTVEILVLDDRSGDSTAALARVFAQAHPRCPLRVIDGAPRPTDRVWFGKAWACDQLAGHAMGDPLLFLDADVRVAPDALATTARLMRSSGAGLLSLLPGLRPGCRAEWMMQPLMFLNIAAACDPTAIARADRPDIGAAGPFLCMDRDAYHAIGGHGAVPPGDAAADDLALATMVKAAGRLVVFLPGPDQVTISMYGSLAALWEGWTKNLYLALGRRWWMVAMLLVWLTALYLAPPMALAAGMLALAADALAPSTGSVHPTMACLGLGLAAAALAIQALVRWRARRVMGLPLRSVLLAPVGAALLMAIAVASMIKVVSGRGLTWRGRALSATTAAATVPTGSASASVADEP